MRSSVLTAILLAVVVVPAAAGVRLILRDGRVLEGTDIRREGQAYLLTLEDGGIVPIPDALVEGVALSDEGTDEDAPATVWPPTGLTDSRPQQLAGEAVSPSLRAEQTRALGPPSRFQQGVIDPNWYPESEWDADAGDRSRNDFAPSQWSESIVDSDWVPENAFPEDRTQFAPSRFQGDIVDPTWVPQDGFSRKG